MATSHQKPFSEFLQEYEARGLLRFTTAGSVDDGKSTLIGRLLHDSDNLRLDQLASLARESKERGRGSDDPEAIDFSLLTDGLKAEREQGITIDVAYRYFSTRRRNFIIADTPGHVQYTRNMATGASTAHLAIILVDARKGLLTQTRRHSFIASLLGIPRLLVAVNKMDLVDYAQDVFDEIRDDFSRFATKLGIVDLKFVPVSALRGDNIVHASDKMPWYPGETILEHLESVYVGSDRNLIDFRFPVQLVLRPNADFRGVSGQIASGRLRVGDEIMVLPSRQRSRVSRLVTFDGDIEEAFSSQSVTVVLEDDLDISRGDLIVRPNNLPQVERRLEAMLIWTDEEELDLRRTYLIQHGPRTVRASVESIHYRVNVDSLGREGSHPLGMNEIGRVQFECHQPLFFDPYRMNRQTGGFILVDPRSDQTVAAGLFIQRRPSAELGPRLDEASSRSTAKENVSSNVPREDESDPAPSDLERLRARPHVTSEERDERAPYSARTFWFTGLSGSGKSTVARAFERRLFDAGRPVYPLDGDTLRAGLNADLGFAADDRAENVRRVSSVAQLFNDAGVTVIVSLISPFAYEREQARERIGAERFFEIAVTTPLEVCEARDPKGLYRRARSGEIEKFTGISDPYERPENPDLELDTSVLTVDECLERLVDLLLRSESD